MSLLRDLELLQGRNFCALPLMQLQDHRHKEYESTDVLKENEEFNLRAGAISRRSGITCASAGVFVLGVVQ